MNSFIKSLLYAFVAINAVNAEKKKILAFGGNGMIGSNTLEQLIATDEYNITMVSRGSWPFDTETKIEPFVKYIYCDREDGIEETCPELVQDISNTDEYYAVLDFSGFLPAWIEDAVKVLKKTKVRVYVYVSSDSVYEVCGDGRRLKKYQKLVETDAERPIDEGTRRKLIVKDEYGDEKLGGEEALVEHAMMNDGFNFVALRYADVVGPRDATDRFATYVMWAKLQLIADKDIIPDLHVPKDVLESTSVTYVKDATQSIINCMTMPDSWNEAYNIASNEIFNVTKTIEMIATHVKGNVPKPKVIRVDAEDGIAMYPSVTRGPINVGKAVSKLSFRPTPLSTVISETVDWYLKMFESDLNYRDVVIAEWETNLFEDSDLFTRRQRNDIMDHVDSKIPAVVSDEVEEADGNIPYPVMYEDDDFDEEDEDEEEL